MAICGRNILFTTTTTLKVAPCRDGAQGASGGPGMIAIPGLVDDQDITHPASKVRLVPLGRMGTHPTERALSHNSSDEHRSLAPALSPCQSLA
ncbi:hypothetical protein CF326_g6351 [Tilletia indica]|nr:hypothetical protein CF326_g6351 [Tilletia indica]